MLRSAPLAVLLLLAACATEDERAERFGRRFDDAKERFERGDYEEARSRCEEIIADVRVDGSGIDALIDSYQLLGRIDERLARYDEAVEEYEHSRIGGSRYEFEAKQGAERVAAKRLTLELPALAGQIAAHPDDPAPLRRRLEILGRQPDHLRFDPASGRPVDQAAADHELAEHDLEHLCALAKPGDPSAELAAMHYYAGQGDHALAVPHAIEAIVAAPDCDWSAYEYLGLRLAADQPDVALGCLAKADALLSTRNAGDDLARVRAERGDALLRRYLSVERDPADLAAADTLFAKLVALAPGSEAAWCGRSQARLLNLDYPAAMEAASKSLALPDSEKDGLYWLGTAEAYQCFAVDDAAEHRRLEELAIGHLEKSLFQHCNLAVGHWTLAVLYDDHLDVESRDANECERAFNHQSLAEHFNPQLPKLDLKRAKAAEEWQKRRQQQTVAHLQQLAHGIDPNTGEPIRDDPSPAEAPAALDELKEIDFADAPRHVEPIGPTIDRNQRRSAELQQRIDDDARWARYRRELERQGHSNSDGS